MKRATLLATLVFLAGCVERTPQTPAQKATSEAIYAYVMERLPDYADERNARAMAACIKWDPNGNEHNVMRAPWYRTDQTSDSLFTANQLMVYAKNVCEEERATKNLDCTCHELAMNDTNLLIVP